MQMVAGIECRKQMIGTLRIARDFVEIHERVEVSRAANPGIDGLTVRFGRGRWMVKSGIRERENRRADDLNAMRACARQDLFVCRDNIFHDGLVLCRGHFPGSRQHSNIVDAFEHDDVSHARLRQHIVIESCQGVWSESVEK